jgi:archaeal flagellin N-terminal-like domain
VKGISSIVATALLLAMTIAGGVLLYTFATKYLANAGSGRIIIHEAYYISSTGSLRVTVENIGSNEVNATGVEVIYSNGDSTNQAINTPVKPGEVKTISISLSTGVQPLYVIVKYDNDKAYTEPFEVRIL